MSIDIPDRFNSENKALSPGQVSVSRKKSLYSGRKNHIMISYNSKSRNECLEIKKGLEESGFDVWMDVTDMHGNSLDAMADAIENSLVVLICITEKYKGSKYCQLEAVYAFHQNKPIIPIILQENYTDPKSWLGILIAGKIYIDFHKYQYKEFMDKLIKEIRKAQLNTKKNKSVESANTLQVSNTPEYNNLHGRIYSF